MNRYDVAIIGAGTAGLSARREVAKVTENYVVIDDGPLGTTCARVGCMPSKVLIQVAADYHRRHKLATEGIQGADALSVDRSAVMEHVRSLRDRFVRSVLQDMESWSDKLLRQRARFVDLNTLDVGGEQIVADRIIIAAGSTPVIPDPWRSVRHRLIDTNEFFELDALPRRLAVVGLGVIGLELGQALHRLGIEVTAITLDQAFGGLSDPSLQQYAAQTFRDEFPIAFDRVTSLREDGNDLLVEFAGGNSVRVDAALVAIGRRPSVAGLGVAELGIPLSRGLPEFDPNTFRVRGTPWYLVGDVNGTRPVLHEASDEGRIAGFNAARSDDQCFTRRTPLVVTFSSPAIGIVGQSYRELTEKNVDFVTGQATYEGQGRAIVKIAERGLLRLYADRSNGRLLGAELLAPDGEHLAHLLAWAVATKLSVRQALSLPFYHPVLEEGVRTALRDAAKQVSDEPPPLELLRCADPPVGVVA